MNNANFEYHVPTHIFFGDNQIQKLGAELAKHGSRVLLIYGEREAEIDAALCLHPGTGQIRRSDAF